MLRSVTQTVDQGRAPRMGRATQCATVVPRPGLTFTVRGRAPSSLNSLGGSKIILGRSTRTLHIAAAAGPGDTGRIDVPGGWSWDPKGRAFRTRLADGRRPSWRPTDPATGKPYPRSAVVGEGIPEGWVEALRKEIGSADRATVKSGQVLKYSISSATELGLPKNWTWRKDVSAFRYRVGWVKESGNWSTNKTWRPFSRPAGECPVPPDGWVAALLKAIEEGQFPWYTPQE